MVPAFFLTKSFFVAVLLEGIFLIKIIKSRSYKRLKIFQKKKRKSRATFCLPLRLVNFSEKNIFKNYSYIGTRAQKVGEIVFYPTLTLLIRIFKESEKGKSYKGKSCIKLKINHFKKGKSYIREELNQIKSTSSSNEIKIQIIINRSSRS